MAIEYSSGVVWEGRGEGGCSVGGEGGGGVVWEGRGEEHIHRHWTWLLV